MRRFLLCTAAAAGTGFLVACSAVLGVDDFTVNPNLGADAGADTGTNQVDGGSSGTVDSGTSGGIDSGSSGGIDGGSDAGGECKVNADCTSKGDNFICRKSDFKCVSLVSADCTSVKGDYLNDNAIIIGTLLPTLGVDQSSGIPIQNAIEVARQEFAAVNNLPGASGRRPLVLVGCNDDTDAVRAAKHLVNDLKVPAIIGAAFSGVTIQVATEVTIPAGVFLISPSATSVAITNLPDNGLVWRTSPSDVIQADGHAAFYSLVEAKIKGGDATRKVKVAIANKGDAYGQGLSTAMQKKLVINGASFLDPSNSLLRLVSDFGDPGSTTPPTYAATISAIKNLEPDLVYLLGTTEVITEVMKGVEAQWPVGKPRPLYLFADGALVAELPDYVNQLRTTDAVAAEDLRSRVLGTVPGTNNANFQLFKILYDAKIKDGTSASTGGAANGYDAFYNIAYSIVAAGSKPITGTTIRDGFANLVGGAQAIDVGGSNINSAFAVLQQSGGKINFNGASGPLDYDIATGEASSDIQIWCLGKLGNGNAAPGASTRVFYNAQTKLLAGGDYATITTDCAF